VWCAMGPNNAFHPTAQQLRCWVPSSLRSSAAGEDGRWASEPVTEAHRYMAISDPAQPGKPTRRSHYYYLRRGGFLGVTMAAAVTVILGLRLPDFVALIVGLVLINIARGWAEHAEDERPVYVGITLGLGVLAAFLAVFLTALALEACGRGKLLGLGVGSGFVLLLLLMVRPSNIVGLPLWATPLIVICAAIPAVSLGGAIPAVIGATGAAGCAAVARRSVMSSVGRLAVCLGLTILCWAIFVVFVLLFAPATYEGFRELLRACSAGRG